MSGRVIDNHIVRVHATVRGRDEFGSVNQAVADAIRRSRSGSLTGGWSGPPKLMVRLGLRASLLLIAALVVSGCACCVVRRAPPPAPADDAAREREARMRARTDAVKGEEAARLIERIYGRRPGCARSVPDRRHLLEPAAEK